ncbi:hypothetical protein BJ508DRAFT_417159 [Ascobolus immersus RN42]|uniref:Uncharacterized protein n=1 Tax=Ascobolus immersus RN42 TaxID=1160509 RepID=A0A3N4HW65_ASCIM|nr:hypothetical protein BJ508DRAFT_417159 [Ascobolus immersus RN42]
MLEMLRLSPNTHAAITWLFEAFEDFNRADVAVTVALCYWRLGDEPGALRMLKRAKGLCESTDSDPVVDAAIGLVEAFIDRFVGLEDEKWHAQAREAGIIPWTGLIPLPEEFEPSPSLARRCTRVLQEWNELQTREFTEVELEGKTPERHVLERYQRAASIWSNETDGLFVLKEAAKERLTRTGFQLAEGIQISHKGTIFNSDNRRIVKDILKETCNLFDFLDNMIKFQVPALTQVSLFKLQARFANKTRLTVITDHEWEENMVCSINPIERYRISTVMSSQEVFSKIQHCPRWDIETTLALLSNHLDANLFDATFSLNPLPQYVLTCSWLLANLYRIQPFEHSEPRLYRLLASIPLRKAGFPPLTILPNQAYIDAHHSAIRIAISTGDFEPLALSILKNISACMSFAASNLGKRFEDRHYRWPSTWDTNEELGYSSDEEEREAERKKAEREASGGDEDITRLEEFMKKELAKVVGEDVVRRVTFNKDGEFDETEVMKVVSRQGEGWDGDLGENWDEEEDDEAEEKNETDDVWEGDLEKLDLGYGERWKLTEKGGRGRGHGKELLEKFKENDEDEEDFDRFYKDN